MFGGKLGVPLVIRTPAGAGAQLTAQHSQSLEVMLAHVPGLKVVAPATPEDAYGMLKSAIRDDDPVIFVENLVLYNVDAARCRRPATISRCRSAVARSCARAAISRSSPTATRCAAR
jgi:pyruvate dehydrogenase E1 component beta subunit